MSETEKGAEKAPHHREFGALAESGRAVQDRKGERSFASGTDCAPSGLGASLKVPRGEPPDVAPGGPPLTVGRARHIASIWEVFIHDFE